MKSSAVIASAAALGAKSVAADAPKGGRQFYELRLYHLRRGPMQKRFDDFYKNAAIPAMNRAGIDKVGVFSAFAGADMPTFYVLLAYESIEAFATSLARVRNDGEFQKAGAEFINAPPTDPSYVRVESSLMLAFEGMPKLEAPEKKSRIFELRTYEAHSKKANQKKIEMFNNGEIAIFRRTGLAPVFFGETIVGTKLPNLTYMLTFENMAAHDANWAKFGGDPEWKKLSSTPGYTDPEILTNITNVFLRPTAYSQI